MQQHVGVLTALKAYECCSLTSFTFEPHASSQNRLHTQGMYAHTCMHATTRYLDHRVDTGPTCLDCIHTAANLVNDGITCQ
jgi:hypothetical protein